MRRRPGSYWQRRSLFCFCLPSRSFHYQYVHHNLNSRPQLTENHTPEVFLRIRIIAVPRQDAFDKFDVRGFRVGQTYDVPVRLASLLVISGYAESAGALGSPAEAADFAGPTF